MKVAINIPNMPVKHADDFRPTPTGPIALIDGRWYSVNGDINRGIIDIRFPVQAPTK
jgi:hypothetical protein